LKSIFRQSFYKKVKIIILDNHSDYDIEFSLANNFTKEELSIVEIIKRPFNIGMYANVASAFLYCKTRWMWLLSDDDETCPNSIETVLSDINNAENIAVLKYSINNFHPEEEKIISNIDDYIQYYKSGLHLTGSLIFMSNNIFNMELLNPYLGYCIDYAYVGGIPHVLPVIAGLVCKKLKIKFRSFALVFYIPPDAGSEWNYSTALLRFASFFDIDFNLTKKQFFELRSIIIRSFSHSGFISQLFHIESKWKRKYIYLKVFRNLYMYDKTYPWIFFFLFYFSYYFGMNAWKRLLTILKKMRHMFGGQNLFSKL
jgi:hypothetical protein